MQFTTTTMASLPTLDLFEDEKKLMTELHTQLANERAHLELDEAYYLGDQVVKNLRIAVPEELEVLQTVLGWGATAVDPLVERLAVDGFRIPGGTDTDPLLDDLWHTNGGDAFQSMLWTDAMSMRRGYLWTGVNLDGAPKITVESPLNVAVKYASDGETAIAALVTYRWRGAQRIALLQPYMNLTAELNAGGEWGLVHREPHSLPYVPIERFANRAVTHYRDGRSQITGPMRGLIDSTARTLLNLEVAREIYSVPQKIILGATEADFVGADGKVKKGWDTYITKVLGLERDEDGNLPEIKFAQPYDPSVFTKLVETAASQFAGMASALPQDLGLYTQGNPTSAEAYDVAERRRNRRAGVKQREWGVSLVRTMQHAVRFLNGGVLPAEYRRIEVDWMPLTEVAMNMDGLAKLVKEGVLPATSDVTLKRVGLSAVERQQLERDRREAEGMAALRQVAEAVSQDDGDLA